MAHITVEPYPTSVTHFCKYGGTYSHDTELDANVYQVKDFSFVITLEFDDDFEKSEVVDIQWVNDESPADKEKAEEEIKKKFNHI